MRDVSARWREVWDMPHSKQVRLSVYTSNGQTLVKTFTVANIVKMHTSRSILKSGDGFGIGNCVSGRITVSLYTKNSDGTDVTIPRMALMIPKIRLVPSDGTTATEWLAKGHFYVDTRQQDQSSGVWTFEGYDALLKAEMDYIAGAVNYPATDTTVVDHIASLIGVTVDSDTYSVINRGYSLPMPIGMSCREVLGEIGLAYGANWIITDEGKLLAVRMGDLPEASHYLVTHSGEAITFGGVRILV